jgi:hypothetical protein
LAINLSDLRQAVIDYLNNKVTVVVSQLTPASGNVIGPGEKFTFSVTVTNASAANGGIALNNVRYVVSVGNANVATIRVPSDGTALDGAGHPINANADVGFFNYDPSGDDLSYLQIGESDSIRLSGTAGTNSAGGNTTITARILADPDIYELFPRNERSTAGIRTVSVVG